MLAPWKKSYNQPKQCIKKQKHYFANKDPYNQRYGFSSSYIWMWELDHKEEWVPKNWYFWTVVLEETLESPLDCKEIKPGNPKENQSWIFFGRKAVINLESILKSRDITLPTKACLVKAMIFPVVMYGCESWIIKTAEHRRIDAFELCYWEDSWESLGLQGDPTSPY